jgi:hypothetical protein
MARPEPKGNQRRGLFPRDLRAIYKGFAGVIAMFALRFVKTSEQRLWQVARRASLLLPSPSCGEGSGGGGQRGLNLALFDCKKNIDWVLKASRELPVVAMH